MRVVAFGPAPIILEKRIRDMAGQFAASLFVVLW
jgi:hypothetical protein